MNLWGMITLIGLLALTGLIITCKAPQRTAALRAEAVWSRPAVMIEDALGGVGVVYLTLVNDGQTPDRLIALESDIARSVEIHETKPVEGRAVMRKVEGGLQVPAKGSVAFQPGGAHIMLIGLKSGLNPGDRFNLTLKFEKGGTLVVESRVRAP